MWSVMVEEMESVAGTDGDLVKKPGCKSLVWDYFGLRVDHERFVILAEWTVLANNDNTSNLMAHLSVNRSSSIHSELQNAIKRKATLYLINI